MPKKKRKKPNPALKGTGTPHEEEVVEDEDVKYSAGAIRGRLEVIASKPGRITQEDRRTLQRDLQVLIKLNRTLREALRDLGTHEDSCSKAKIEAENAEIDKLRTKKKKHHPVPKCDCRLRDVLKLTKAAEALQAEPGSEFEKVKAKSKRSYEMLKAKLADQVDLLELGKKAQERAEKRKKAAEAKKKQREKDKLEAEKFRRRTGYWPNWWDPYANRKWYGY